MMSREVSKMIDELKNMVKNSTEEEAKSILYFIFSKIQVAEQFKRYSDNELIEDIKKMYSDFLKMKQDQAISHKNKPYNVAHVVFGDSAAGSLKIALQKLGLQEEEKVISLSDMFSIGPTWQLHKQVGLNNRYEWLMKHINIDEEVLDSYQENFNKSTVELKNIPNETSIIIWMADNAHEQIGLRFVLYLLKEKTNEITVINTSASNTNPNVEYLHTGEISHDIIKLIYEKHKEGTALTQSERKYFEQEWEQLASNQEVLRIWENETIKSVHESYYDDFIIKTAEKLHKRKNSTEFIKSARLIGEVMGQLNQYVGDQFLEYRIIRLIVNGVFDIEGVPKAMRFYSIKLR
jgi:hypothetical protein